MPIVVVPTPEGERRCHSCDSVMPLARFPRNRHKPLGRAHQCSDCSRRRVRAYQRRNPGARLVLHHRRRARARGAPGDHTRREWNQLKQRFGFRCLACGIAEPLIRLTRDHVVPLGPGSNGIENIQPLCVSCNSKKSSTYREYRPERLLPCAVS